MFKEDVEFCRDDGPAEGREPWNIYAFNGWMSLREVILKTGTYFLTIYRFLLTLEEMLKLRAERDKSEIQVALTGLGVPNAFAQPRKFTTAADLLEHLNHLALESKGLVLMRTEKRLVHMREYIQSTVQTLPSTPFAAPLDLTGDARIVDEVRTLREALVDDLDDRWIFSPP